MFMHISMHKNVIIITEIDMYVKYFIYYYFYSNDPFFPCFIVYE